MGATSDGTKSYSHLTPPNLLGKTGWSVSPVGFGGYRIHPQLSDHRDALKLALKSGCNLIDTSANYGDGGSEKLIGEVLREMTSAGEIKREQIVVVSKAGYMQGENLKLARQRKDRGIAYPEVVEFSEDCWHCISPDFLKDQITRSLQRLGLEQIDVLLLHNPEYFFKTGGDHAEYYRRIGAAMKYLETEVSGGRIQFFGVSSNTFPEPKESEDFTSLDAVYEIASQVGAKHFAVVQFPFNLYEPEAAFEPNNDGKTVFETAEVRNLGMLINRPLNAYYGNKLIRLAEFPSHPEKDVEEALKNSFLDALQIESEFPAKDVLPVRNVSWAHVLRHNFEKISDIEGFKNIVAHQIEPALEEVEPVLNVNPEHRAWFEEYRAAIETLCSDLTDYLEEVTALLSKRIDKILEGAVPELHSSKTLSQKVIRVYRSIPGASSVLVGMRKAEYVRDAMTLAPPISPEHAMDALDAIQQDIQEGAAEPHTHET